MPQLAGGGGGGDPELCATDEMIPFKDEGDPQKEQIFAEINHSEEEGDLAEIKSSLVNETEISPNSNGHDVSIVFLVSTIDLFKQYVKCMYLPAQVRPHGKLTKYNNWIINNKRC